MVLHLLHHKSWHVYNQDNVARVQRDEAKARGEEEETDRRLQLADSEARLDRMRKRNRKDRDGQGAGEKELERQLKGLPKDDERREEGGTVIIRPDGWKGKAKEGMPSATDGVVASTESKHINFWSEFEAGAKTTLENPEVLMEKAKEKAELEGLTKVYLAKKGEGEPTGWYADKDGKTEKERKEPVEVTLERAYKDGEHKRLSDPMALMNVYLKRRSDVLSGVSPQQQHRSSRERYPTPSTPATPSSPAASGSWTPILAPLLAPKRRRGEPPQPSAQAANPPPIRTWGSSSSSMPPPPLPSTSSVPSSHQTQAEAEATTRVSSERARAAALIAAAKRKREGSSVASSSEYGGETPKSETGGWGMYNKQETREARESRGWGSAKRGREVDGQGGYDGRGGWGEQKRRRDERERGTWGGSGGGGGSGGSRRDWNR